MLDENPRVLIADDDEINRIILAESLSKDIEIVFAKNGKEVLDVVSNGGRVDLILMDIMMPEMDGFEALRRIKELEKVKDVPVILLTALNSVDNEKKGLKLGAADYIRKPLQLPIVRLRVENHLKFYRQMKLMENLVGIDGLTEINNRRNLDRLLDIEWKRAKRNNSYLSFVMMDVDYFKPYNDNYGHAKGDEVLKSIAKAISRQLRRPSDLVARYGGEEFALILPETDKEGGKIIGEKVRKAVDELEFKHKYSKAASNITISVGGVTTSTYDGKSKDLIEGADKALYMAKELGRNRVEWVN